MKTISLWLFTLSFIFLTPLARAQDDATQQQIDKLSGQIQDVLDAQAEQDKRIDSLKKEISDLRDKSDQPGANDFASTDDLKKLAQQVQEIDKKRQDDNDKILQALEKLGKSGGETIPVHQPKGVSTTTSTDSLTANARDKQNGYWQVVSRGDTFSAIAKAYRDKGVKVTTEQILAANPGLNPNTLKVGQKIFIPAPQ